MNDQQDSQAATPLRMASAAPSASSNPRPPSTIRQPDARYCSCNLFGKLEAFNDSEKTRGQYALAHTIELLETCGTSANMKHKLDAMARSTHQGEEGRSMVVGSSVFVLASPHRSPMKECGRGKVEGQRNPVQDGFQDLHMIPAG
eukprot:2715366-Rhodomonas_salina.1